MKRSEMINEIIDAVFMASADDLHLAKEEAEYILERLEKKGIKPPEYLKPIEGTPLVPGDIKREDGLWGSPAAEWEPEDDPR